MINKVAFTGNAKSLTKTVAKVAKNIEKKVEPEELIEAKYVKASMDLTGTANAAKIPALETAEYASPFANIVEIEKPVVQGPVINRNGLNFFA